MSFVLYLSQDYFQCTVVRPSTVINRREGEEINPLPRHVLCKFKTSEWFSSDPRSCS
jgi:hypothetical protein